MPQMAPTSWIAILILTMSLLTFFMANIPKKTTNQYKLTAMKKEDMKMKW